MLLTEALLATETLLLLVANVELVGRAMLGKSEPWSRKL